jgi:hypothetical protein
MAVTESLGALGSWSVQLSASTPKEILSKLQYFGHITIHTGDIDSRVAGDALLRSSRYTGVYRGKTSNGDTRTLTGAGMAFWLGDEEDKGDIIEAPLAFNAATFSAIMTGLLPPGGAVTAGTFFAIPGATTHSFNFQYKSRRKAIDYVCDTLGADWRVNGDATLDAGPPSDLYNVIPKSSLVQHGSGVDMFLRTLDGNIETNQDIEDFTTRTLLLAEGQESSTVTATADINPILNPYKNLYGTPVKLTRIISESETDATNAQARAQLQLNRFSGTRDAITCSTAEFDVKGTVVVGDYMWVFAPDEGVYDLNNEVIFLGDRMYPMRLRLREMTWPVTGDMTISFRDGSGVWTDLTPYFIPESGESSLVVGGYNRSLIASQDGGPAGSRPIADVSVPAAPTWNTPFTHSVYQSVMGESLAQVQLRWNQPLNVDGTAILDGDHYEVRFRSSTTPIFPSTHAQMAARTHDQLALGTHEQPIVYQAGPWQTQYVPFSELTSLLQGLPTNMPYEAQIRALDSAKPPNAGAWSAVTVFQTSGDTLPPSAPAPPVVAASVIAVQIKHDLGRSDGGTFNLEPDLHHLEVHGQYEPLFTPNAATLLGRLPANKGMMQSFTAAVGTFNTDSIAPVYFKVIAVDNDGNLSQPSVAVQATALLVDDSHISNLTVSKVTAGTITADWLVGAKIISGDPVAGRVQLVPAGLEAYNPSGVRTIFLEAATGEGILTGRFQSGVSGRRVIINPTSTPVPEIWFEPTPGSVRHAYINSLGGTGDIWLGLNSGPTLDVNGLQTTMILAPTFSMWSYNTTAGAPGPFSARRGGWFAVSAVDALMGWNDDSTGTEWRYKIDSNGSHSVRGRYQQFVTDGGLSALYVNQVGGSGTNATIGYGATMASVPIPLVDIMPTSGATAGKYHCVGARSTTSFTVEYPAGNCDIFIWAVRYG